MNYEFAQNLFVEYLTRLGGVMNELSNQIIQDIEANKLILSAS